MANIETMEPTQELMLELRKNLRQEDACEILRYGIPIRKAVWQSYKTAIVRKIVTIDGKVAAMWGVSGHFMGTVGIPWLLTTSLVENYPLAFALYYRQEVKKMLRLFPKLENYVDAKYNRACKLLEMIGFTLDEPKPYGPNNALFRRFHMEARMTEVKKCLISEIIQDPNFDHVQEAYGRESFHLGLPAPKVKLENYVALEKAGKLSSFGAFFNGKLVGLMTVLMPVLPHFDEVVAVSESFFVLKEHRERGFGTRLRQMAEEFAENNNAVAIIISSPIGGDLVKVLPRSGYTAKSISFVKKFSKELATVSINSMTPAQISKVTELENHSLQNVVQQNSPVHHVLHAGMYARTIKVTKGKTITGALIKVATILIVSGDLLVYLGDETKHLTGYHVFPAAAFRKQAFHVLEDSYITMIFPSDAKDVHQAEEEFTDDFARLGSRKPGVPNVIVATEA